MKQTETPFLLRLPAVRGPLETWAVPGLAGVPRLWPGLPERLQVPSRLPMGRNAWLETAAPHGPWVTPQGLPYAPEEAAACLEDLRRMSEAALSGVPLESLGQMAGRQDALRRQSEAAARRAFAVSGCGDGGTSSALQAAEQAERDEQARGAQRMLLWSWLQEERLAEMAALGSRMRAGQQRLDAMLSDAEDVAEAQALSALSAVSDMAAPDAADLSLLPPWERMLDAAAFFLPEGTVFLAEGPMREALLEREDLRPLTGEERALFPVDAPLLCGVRAPLWRLLQRPRAPRCRPHWEKMFLLTTWEQPA